jgi:hypothetical protein
MNENIYIYIHTHTHPPPTHLRIIKPQHQLHSRTLPSATRPNEGTRLPRRHLQTIPLRKLRPPIDNLRRPIGVPKGDPLKFNLPFKILNFIPHTRLCIDRLILRAPNEARDPVGTLRSFPTVPQGFQCHRQPTHPKHQGHNRLHHISKCCITCVNQDPRHIKDQPIRPKLHQLCVSKPNPCHDCLFHPCAERLCIHLLILHMHRCLQRESRHSPNPQHGAGQHGPSTRPLVL